MRDLEHPAAGPWRLPDTAYLLTPKAAAAELNVSLSLLNKLRWTGGGPLYCKIGRNVRYRRQDLQAYLADQTRSSTSQGE